MAGFWLACLRPIHHFLMGVIMKNENQKPNWQVIAETQSPHELSQGHSFWLWAYRIGIGGSFAALAMFIIERMAGTDAQIWEWTAGQMLNGGIGFVFAFVFSAFVYGFYLTDYSIKKRLFVFLVAVSFPLFAEVSQTMHRGEESTISKSQSSPEFIAAQKALATMTGTNPTVTQSAGIAEALGEKAKHGAELANCTRYTSPARVQKCQRYERTKIAEADGKAAGYNVASTAASSAHHEGLQATIKQIGELGNNENHAHAMVKLLMSFGMSLLWASLVMAILIIGSIEAALAWLGGNVKDFQNAMRARGLEIGNQKRAVVRFSHDDSHPTLMSGATTIGNANSTPPVAGFADSARQTVNEYATKAAETIATENAKAQYARANTYNIAGDALDNAVIKMSGGFKQSPEQRQNAINLASMTSPASGLVSANADKTVSGSTYREELRNGSQRFEDMPLDQLTKPAATLPHDQRNGATGAHNPALGQQEEQHTLPLLVPTPSTSSSCVQQPTLGASSPTSSSHVQQPTLGASSHDAELLAAIKEAKQSVSSEVLKESVTLYPVWRANVVAQTITPAKKPAHALMSEHWCRGGKAVTPTPPQMDKVWAIWQARAAKEGILKDNPTFKPGNRQARYVLAG